MWAYLPTATSDRATEVIVMDIATVVEFLATDVCVEGLEALTALLLDGLVAEYLEAWEQFRLECFQTSK